MDLPEGAIKEFQLIYKEKVGEEISYEKAKTEAENFITLYDLVTKRVKRDTNISKKPI